MKYFHRFFIYVLLFIGISSNKTIKAQDNFYYVYDAISNETNEFETYDEAYSFYLENLDIFDNLVLAHNDVVIHMEYGIVKFNTDEACSITIDYHSVDRNSDEYLNACYGIDGAYLYTNEKADSVYYLLANEKAYTSINNVTLIPYEKLNSRISTYTNLDGNFYHNIKTQMEYDYYSYSLNLDNALPYLSNKDYYSYDGHYFYDDFKLMIDDYRNDSRDNAINEEAYYNYYQYLPHHSLSNYKISEIEDYFYNTLGINNYLNHYTDFNYDGATDEINRSQLFNNINDFFVNQYMYGNNALMLISSAINESSYGKNLNSFISNNLYSVAAYENQKESNDNKYNDISSSIYSHSKYIINSLYSNYRRSTYTGTFYGDKLSGINTTYSIDPYYGQKCASTYRELDIKNGNKDYNSLAIGLIKDKDIVNFYRDASLNNRQFTLENINELAYVIISEEEDSYKISIDSSNLDGYLYSFNNCVSYVKKDTFDLILNEDKIHEYDLINIHYDFNEGEYKEYKQIDIEVDKNQDPLFIKAKKVGYELIGYENNIAQYKKIEKIELHDSFNSDIELKQYIDLANSYLTIYYDDNTSKNISINSEMISAYDNNSNDRQILLIDYCGLQLEKQIQFDERLYEKRTALVKAIEEKDYQTIRKQLASINYPLTFSQIRDIDYELKQINNRNYVINDKTERYNVSISGLDLSLKDKQVFGFISDTYYVVINDISINDRQKIESFASGYGFEAVEGLNISFRFNYEKIELDGPAIVQIDLKDKKTNHVYTVYHLTDDNDIIKCRTTQSENFIQFMINETGSYLVLSMPSVNEYDLRDNTEDLSYENMGYDNHHFNFVLMSLMLITLISLIGITIYHIVYNERKKIWKDFRKSLQIAGLPQEEKQNN